jgi:hypothetical protein
MTVKMGADGRLLGREASVALAWHSVVAEDSGQCRGVENAIRPEFKLFGGGIFQAGAGVVGQWAKAFGE